MKLSVAFSSAPVMAIGCRKPSLPSVVSGEQVSFRQAIDDGGCDLDRVLHLALGKAGMGADAFDGDGGAVGRKRLVLDIAGGFAIHRVGEVGAELFQIDLVDAAADLLVGREQDLDRAVLDLRVLKQEMRRIHDLGEAGLVVGAEQRGAVGRDDVVADLVGQARDDRRTRITCVGIARAARCRRRDNFCTICGLTSLPVQSGEVSICEQKQITGTFLSVFAGMVA